MKKAPKRTAYKLERANWKRFDALTDAQVLASARSDPDAQPLTDADFKRMKRVPQAKVIRQSQGLSQEEFATRFQIPIGTLRDWEQGRAEPDQAARAYLKVIAFEPATVGKALLGSSKEGSSRRTLPR